jgi:hypothetical protein
VYIVDHESRAVRSAKQGSIIDKKQSTSLFIWLVADDWCWFVLREKYCWLMAGG